MISLVKLTAANKSLCADAELSKKTITLTEPKDHRSQLNKLLWNSSLIGTVDIQNPSSTFVSSDKHVLQCSAAWTSRGVVSPGWPVSSRIRFQENDCSLVLQLLHFCYVYSNVFKCKYTKVLKLPGTSAVLLVILQRCNNNFLAVG